MKEGNLSMFTCVALFVCDGDEASAACVHKMAFADRKGKVVIVWDIQIMSLWILCLNYQEQK